MTATSLAVGFRGGSGSRALCPDSIGRSAAKTTLRSGVPAIARMQPATARLKGSAGPSTAFWTWRFVRASHGRFRQLRTTFAVD